MLVPVTIRGDSEESRVLIIIITSVNTFVLICITFVLGTRQNKCFGRVLVIFFTGGGVWLFKWTGISEQVLRVHPICTSNHIMAHCSRWLESQNQFWSTTPFEHEAKKWLFFRLDYHCISESYYQHTWVSIHPWLMPQRTLHSGLWSFYDHWKCSILHSGKKY